MGADGGSEDGVVFGIWLASGFDFGTVRSVSASAYRESNAIMRFKLNHVSKRSKRRQRQLRNSAKHRSFHGRRLLYEMLEDRRLLAVDFIAYNDHAVGQLTHANTTTFGDNPGGTNNGFLKDISTGLDTGVTLTTTSVGIAFQNNSSNPAAGTDAADVFGGFVDFTSGNPHSLETVASQGDSYTHAFSGLDPLSTYEFAGTAIRSNDNYTNRWTLVTLTGADSFISAHSIGVGVVTAGLQPNQVAIWTGANHNASQGYVAQWTDIDPGADSTFEVVSTQYLGPTPGVGNGDSLGGSKGYALNGIRLIQNTAITPPTVINNSASDIEAFTATIAGDVTDIGNEAPAVTVYWGASDEGTTAGNWDNSIALGAQSGSFSSALSGLAAETDYFFRAHAQNAAGETWAPSTESFTTRALTVPSVVNSAATQVEAFTAQLNGNVIDTGGDPPGITLYWGDDDAGTTAGNWDNAIGLGPQTGAFIAFVDNLQENTTYFYRAQAANVAGSTWAPSTESFTTLPVTLPAIVNTAATNVEPFSADIGGEVTDTGGDAPVVTLYYGDNDGGTVKNDWDASIDLGTIFGVYSETIPNLTAETSYYFRAHAVNAAGEVWATPTNAFQTPTAPLLQISELMASNDTTLQTRIRPFPGGPLGAVMSPDWIEVQNLTNQPVDLGGFYLTDDVAVPLKWAFPAGTTIAANGFLLVMASNEDITNPALDEFGYLHTDFKLTKSGEYLAIHINDGAASVVHAYDPAFPEQIKDISYGIGADELPHFYATPTPGAANTGEINFVDDTKFSVDRGFYDAPIDVAITSDTVDAEIYYTLNGDEPTNVPSATNFLYADTIHINKTTTLRAKAFKAGFEPTNSDTHTYLFLDDVVQQTYQSTLDAGFPSSWDGTGPDYGLDLDVIGPGDNYGGKYAATIKDDLLALPTLSIVTNVDDLFGSNGIYSHPTNHSLETATSLELISPDGSEEFQVNAGLKIQGGYFRNFNATKKKSFRVKFKSEYGPSKLNFPFFGDDATDQFDTITFRMNANDGWQWGGSSNRQYARDQFGRDSQLAIGQPASHGRFMHLYVNGFYWGVYNPVERPDHSFGATYFGGDKDNWDVRNHGGVVNGDLTAWNTLIDLTEDVENAAAGAPAQAAYQKLQGNNPDGSSNSAFEDYLDVNNLADYLIVNWYMGNRDWPHNNYYTGRLRGPESTGFKFFMWDAEWSLFLQNNINTNQTGNFNGVVEPHGNLRNNPDYRLMFADHVQKSLFEPGGTFYVDPVNPTWDPAHPERNVPAARYAEIVDAIESPLVGESARWGDQHQSTPYTVDESWAPVRDNIMNNWFPFRTEIMKNQFRGAGLYPSFDAPLYQVNGSAQHGGVIDTNDSISFGTTVSGTVYYTLDGSDPRAIDGTVRPEALVYSSAFNLAEADLISARLLTDGGEWSALTQARFFVDPLATIGDLAITEVHYNPDFPTAGELAAQQALDPGFDPANADGNDYEFIEVMNVTGQTVNLFGARLRKVDGEGVDFTFGDVTLDAGERIVVAGDLAAFEARYGAGINIAGAFSGNLNNGGELLTLSAYSAAGTTPTADFVLDGDTGKLLIPTGSGSEVGWQNNAFDDSTWTNATNGIGFDTGAGEISGGFQMRVLDTSSGDVANIGIATNLLDGNTAGFTIGADVTREQPYINHGDSGNLGSPAVLPMFGTPDREHYAVRVEASVTIPAGTWTIDVGSDDGFRLTLPGVNFISAYNLNGSDGTGTDNIAYSAPRAHNHTGGAFTLAAPLVVPLTLDFYERGGGDSVELSIAATQQGGFSTGAFSILQAGQNNWQVTTPSQNVDYDPLINTDVESVMLNLASSAYLRFPFVVSDVANLTTLTLGVKYDDAMVVYLNGNEVARRNFTGAPAANSVADATRPDAQAVVQESINLDSFIGQLQNGDNLLAIHAINSAASDPDLLMVPELVARFGGDTIVGFEYNDSGPWPGRADGNGSSLEIVSALGDPNLAGSWRSSNEYHGSPDSAGSGPVVDIVINEVLSHTNAPQVDAVELLNTSGQPIDVGGWYLSDSSDGYKRFQFPDPTVIPAGQYLVVDESDFNSSGGLDPNDFAFSSFNGGDVWLLEADGNDKLIRFVDHVEFGAAISGESFGRWPNATGELYPMVSYTPSADNSGPRVGPLVISEVMYNPPDSDGVGGVDPNDLEFFEILNTTNAAVTLTDWRIRKGVDFDFAPGSSIAAGQSIVVLSFDPDNPANSARVDDFRTHYGIDNSVVLVGGYSGKLDNDGEKVQLQRPGTPPLEDPNLIPRLIEDEVVYSDEPPWTTQPDGGGQSLTRKGISTWGNDATSWAAAAPSPGQFNEAPTGVSLTNAVTSMAENTDTTNRSKLADIQVADDALGTNEISLTGADAASFEVDGFELFLKAGEILDFESQGDYEVTVNVIDSIIGGATLTVDHTLGVTDVNEAPTGVALANAVATLVENTDTTNRTKLADIDVTDDALGTNEISLTGADAASFEVDGLELFLKAGEMLDFESQASYEVTVNVEDSLVVGAPVSVEHTLSVTPIRVFTVNSTGDGGDTNPGDGVAEDADGNTTLRAAIEEANALPNFGGVPDTISFDINGVAVAPHVIQVLSALPDLREAVIIDGTSEPDWEAEVATPVVEIDGTIAGVGASGLTVGNGADGSVIRGLAINGFDQHGVFVSRRNNVTVERNFIGTDSSGIADRGNGQVGVKILNGAGNTLTRNLIVANEIGVLVEGPQSTGNVIEVNVLGMALDESELRNRFVNIDIAGAPDNTVGGPSGRGNIIVGSRVGVAIRGDRATGNVVQGNMLGINLTETAIPNTRGVSVKNSASANTIGGLGDAGNVISGNTKGVEINRADNNLVHGNKIGTSGDGMAEISNVRGVVIRNAANNQIGNEPNVISGNDRQGVRILGEASTGNVVRDNFIGTNLAGDAAIPNRNGVVISPGANGNTVGGTTVGARNVVSGNERAGLLLKSNNNTIIGNLIGTDAAGNAALANETGVYIDGGAGNTIGGSISGSEGNLISGNSERGVLVAGNGANSNTIAGNAIGTNLGGTSAVANKHGVRIEVGAHTIGGATADVGNLISGNAVNGVYLIGVSASGNLLQSNRIGINIDGSAAIPNERSGVLVENAQDNMIGNAVAGNAIGGNTQTGIKISGASATGNLVQNNSIGMDSLTMTPIGNHEGIRVSDGASGNTIGGDADTSANEIAHNTGRGVWVSGGSGNAISENAIHDNAALGIAVGSQNATPNDIDDDDIGANNLQNIPELNSATLSAGNLSIQYVLTSSTANSAYPITIEFFMADASGAQGGTFLGTDDLASPGSTTASIRAGPATANSAIVATATDANGNTSEFSPSVNAGLPLQVMGGEIDEASGATRLTQSMLNPIVTVAIAKLNEVGLRRELFANVQLTVADLSGATLGLAVGNSITIDVNAAGYGWNIETAPLDETEFKAPKSIDLLTTVMHELGHVAGLSDLYDADDDGDLMFAWLEPGVRKTSTLVDEVFAESAS
jgi:hypothetical protein